MQLGHCLGWLASLLKGQVQLCVALRPVRFLLLRLLDHRNGRNDISAVNASHFTVKCIYTGEGVLVHLALIWVLIAIGKARQAHSAIIVGWVEDAQPLVYVLIRSQGRRWRYIDALHRLECNLHWWVT